MASTSLDWKKTLLVVWQRARPVAPGRPNRWRLRSSDRRHSRSPRVDLVHEQPTALRDDRQPSPHVSGPLKLLHPQPKMKAKSSKRPNLERVVITPSHLPNAE